MYTTTAAVSTSLHLQLSWAAAEHVHCMMALMLGWLPRRRTRKAALALLAVTVASLLVFANVGEEAGHRLDSLGRFENLEGGGAGGGGVGASNSTGPAGGDARGAGRARRSVPAAVLSDAAAAAVAARAESRWRVNCRLEPFCRDHCSWGPSAVHQPGEPVLVFQYGKVGSSAVAQFVHSAKGVHTGRAAASWLAKLDGGRTNKTGDTIIWVVTMVRNRFLRDVSALFENKAKFAVALHDGFEKLHVKFKDAKAQSDDEHKGSLTEINWFRDVFAATTGVDLVSHAREFSPPQRSLFVSSGRFRVLLLRFEDIQYWPEILPKYFPDFRNRTLKRTNSKPKTGIKAAQYNDFRARVEFTEEEVQTISGGDSAVFYSACERKEMIRAARSRARYSICTDGYAGRLCAEEEGRDGSDDERQQAAAGGTDYRPLVDQLERQERLERQTAALPMLLRLYYFVEASRTATAQQSGGAGGGIGTAMPHDRSFEMAMVTAAATAVAAALALGCAVAAGMTACSYVCETLESYADYLRGSDPFFDDDAECGY
eukprot:SAG22_NODE_118_length_19263_cov_16.155813_1_plen_543_part_00